MNRPSPPLLTFAQHYLEGHFAPYVRERRVSGSAPLTMLEIAQPAGDFSDPPLSDLIFAVSLTSHRGTSRVGGVKASGLIRSGTFTVAPPRVDSRILLDEPNAFRVLAVPERTVNRVLAELGHRISDGLLDAALVGNQENALIVSLLDRLWMASADPAPSSLFADSAVVVLLHEMVRHCGEAARPPSAGGLAPWQVRRVMDFLHEHLASDVTLPELAGLVGLSQHHFCRAFKASTGQPPHRTHLRLRMERAQQLLIRTELSIAAVAAAVGYDDPGQFGRAFRKQTGVSPSRFRRARPG